MDLARTVLPRQTFGSQLPVLCHGQFLVILDQDSSDGIESGTVRLVTGIERGFLKRYRSDGYW